MLYTLYKEIDYRVIFMAYGGIKMTENVETQSKKKDDKKRTISVYFQKEVWEKLKRVKRPSKLINRALRNHYKLEQESEEVIDELHVYKEFVDEFMACQQSETYYSYVQALQVCEEVRQYENEHLHELQNGTDKH